MNEVKNIEEVSFAKHMYTNYLLYAKDVIEGRAIPAAEDGLKPVQRRILQSLNGLGLHANTSYKKSARTVGECLGRYHLWNRVALWWES